MHRHYSKDPPVALSPDHRAPPQVYSRDLLLWRIATTVLVPSDGLPWDDSLWRTAYQYAGVDRR